MAFRLSSIRKLPAQIANSKPKLQFSRSEWIGSTLYWYFKDLLHSRSTQFRKFGWNQNQFVQMGLLSHDVMTESDEFDVAVEMLPKDIAAAREARIARAFQLSFLRNILPREEWTKFEDDVPYMDPYIEAVRKRKKEEILWNIEAHS